MSCSLFTAFVANKLHHMERVLFRASFSCEVLVRVSRASVMGLSLRNKLKQNNKLFATARRSAYMNFADRLVTHCASSFTKSLSLNPLTP